MKRPYSKLLRQIVKYCDKIVTNSMSLLDKVKKLPDKAEDKVELVHHSLNCKKFSQIPNLEDIENFKDKYDLNQAKTIILLQGPYITRKSQNEVIGYFPDILKEHKDTNYLIIGEGPLLPKIKEEVVNLNIDDSTVITGYISDEELLVAYHISDILIYPAQEGSFGTPLIEAMASGLPVIAIDKPPMNEMLPPDSGWLYERNNQEMFLEKVSDIIKNKKVIQKTTYKLQKHALMKYDYPVVGKKLVKVYSKTIKENQ